MNLNSGILFLILGKNQSGKSTFLREKIYPCLTRLVVLDTVNEYFPIDREGVDDLLGYGTVVVETVDEFKDAYVENWPYKSFRIICKFKDDDYEDVLPYVHRAGKTSLIIEEIDLLEFRKGSALLKLFTKSQHCRVNVFATTQRAAEISKTITSQSHVVISFRQDEALDVERYKKYMPNVYELMNLSVGQYRVIKGVEQFNALMTLFNQKKQERV